MVAKFNSGKGIKGAIEYSEHKIMQGKARLIASNGYLKDCEKLTFNEKLFRLTDLAQRNSRTKTNAVHISLNFHTSEHFDREKLTSITEEYMMQIGFGDQPYLVYEHLDAGHPHVHIVTTNIKANTKRIDLHYIGERLSEPAREAVEVLFDLVKAKGNKFDQAQDNVGSLTAAEYGKNDTKRVITNIVNSVAKGFKYTSLPELNAVLKNYNVTADRGSKESVMYKHGGLNYWITDNHGKKIGVPIKASSIYLKPTIKLLEGRFKLNEALRKPMKGALIKKINKAIQGADSLRNLKELLKNENVALVVRQNDEGRIYGLTYVDYQAKVVFNGSDLGKAYSATAIIEALQNPDKLQKEVNGKLQHAAKSEMSMVDFNSEDSRTLPNFLSELLEPVDPNNLQGDFGPKRKKKKRRKLNL